MNSASSEAVSVFVNADTHARLKLDAGGRLTWGDGTANGDVNLYRDGANSLKTDDDLTVAGVLKLIASSGSEGGEIQLAAAASGTTLSGPIKVDIYENKLRFFEGGGSNRGAYLDLTATAGGVGTNLLGTSGAMNYAQTVGSKQSNISTSGTTIVSVSITTNGYPVQVVVTGDVENNSAGGWTVLQLYRGSTAIGNPVHTEGSAGSENVPYALTVIDTPDAGTYTYALKLNNSAGGTFNFGESNGPVITAVELAGKTGAAGPAGDISTSVLNDLSDVTITSPSNGQVLKYNGAAWVNGTDSTGTTISSIDDIADVTIASAASGDFLKWNGSAWVNDPINLSTDTVGDYVASLVAGTGITITNNSGEGATPTVAVTSNTYDVYGSSRDSELKFLMEVI